MVYLYNGYGTHKRDYYPGGGHVVDYREILRRHSLGDSIRAIALGVNSSRDTVSATLRAASAAGVEWPLDPCASGTVCICWMKVVVLCETTAERCSTRSKSIFEEIP